MNDQPAIKLKYEEPGAAHAAPQRPAQSLALEAIWGTLRIIDAAPDWTPRGRFEDSVAVLIDGGTPNLCMYDYTNAQWLFAELSTTRIP